MVKRSLIVTEDIQKEMARNHPLEREDIFTQNAMARRLIRREGVLESVSMAMKTELLRNADSAEEGTVDQMHLRKEGRLNTTDVQENRLFKDVEGQETLLTKEELIKVDPTETTIR